MPEGSVFGPFFFFIYINDLTHEVQSSEIRLWDDDAVLYVIVDNPAESIAALMSDLQRVSDWASE